MERYVFEVSDSEGYKSIYVINEEQKRLYDQLRKDNWINNDNWEWGECIPYSKVEIINVTEEELYL